MATVDNTTDEYKLQSAYEMLESLDNDELAVNSPFSNELGWIELEGRVVTGEQGAPDVVRAGAVMMCLAQFQEKVKSLVSVSPTEEPARALWVALYQAVFLANKERAPPASITFNLQADSIKMAPLLHSAARALGCGSEGNDADEHTAYTISRQALAQLYGLCGPHGIPAASLLPPNSTRSPPGLWHPVRSLKPAPGTRVYARPIPHLSHGQAPQPCKRTVFAFTAIDNKQKRHVDLVEEWMNNPRVDKAWMEKGDRAKHERFTRERVEDAHSLSLIGSFLEREQTFTMRKDKQAFEEKTVDKVHEAVYTEVYWVKEDRLGPLFDSRPYDRGVHMLVGNEGMRGKHRVKAWLPSLVHYCFLDDVRTTRVIAEVSASTPYRRSILC